MRLPNYTIVQQSRSEVFSSRGLLVGLKRVIGLTLSDYVRNEYVPAGRAVETDRAGKGIDVLIMSLYIPCEGAARRTAKNVLRKIICDGKKTHNFTHLILGGDFNMDAGAVERLVESIDPRLERLKNEFG